MTQLQAALEGVVALEITRVAMRENVTSEFIRDEVARGRLVIPANVRHLAGSAGRAPRMRTVAQNGSSLEAVDAEHTQLRAAIAKLPPARLPQVPKGSKIDNAKLIYGIAAHDLYHAGQIRLLKSLSGKKG